MMIGFFVNDLEREYANYTTTVLAHMAADRGHRVCYITPSDFVLNCRRFPVASTAASCPSASTRTAPTSSTR